MVFQEKLFFKNIFHVFPELSKIQAFFKVFQVFQVCENPVISFVMFLD